MRFYNFDSFREPKTPIKTLSYGVSYLNDATGGIMPNDLVVIGGRTGAGKTALVARIAQVNAKNLKRVHVFSLESYHGEFHDRIKFRYLSAYWYNKFNEILHFREWLKGAYSLKTQEAEAEINSSLSTALNDLEIFYRTSGEFGIRELKVMIASIKDRTDLIIIDHLHYLDSDTDNELKAVKEILKEIRDLCLLYNKPIILVAHLRKKDRHDSDLAPSLDEFHGSSDITKIATQVITLAPYYGLECKSFQAPTIFRVSKSRVDNSCNRFYGMHIFDIRLDKYNNKYKIGNVFDCSKEFKETVDAPWWAENVDKGGLFESS